MQGRLRQELKGCIHQQLGFWPGNKRVAGDHKITAIKFFAANYLCKGLACGTQGNKRLYAFQILCLYLAPGLKNTKKTGRAGVLVSKNFAGQHFCAKAGAVYPRLCQLRSCFIYILFEAHRCQAPASAGLLLPLLPAVLALAAAPAGSSAVLLPPALPAVELPRPPLASKTRGSSSS